MRIGHDWSQDVGLGHGWSQDVGIGHDWSRDVGIIGHDWSQELDMTVTECIFHTNSLVCLGGAVLYPEHFPFLTCGRAGEMAQCEEHWLLSQRPGLDSQHHDDS